MPGGEISLAVVFGVELLEDMEACEAGDVSWVADIDLVERYGWSSFRGFSDSLSLHAVRSLHMYNGVS